MKSFENREQALEYVQSLSITQVMNLCADLIMETQTPKIFLTQQQLEKFFKVQGLRFVPETRGRNKKTEEM